MIKKLYVHGGSFHADDVFCAAVLSIINRNLEVERVLITGKDLTDIENGILMADIGGGAFDHHQEDAAIRKDGIKHSAVTLRSFLRQGSTRPQDKALRISAQGCRSCQRSHP